MARTRIIPSRDLLDLRFNLSRGEGNVSASGRASELLAAGVVGTLAAIAGVYVGYFLAASRRGGIQRTNQR